MNAKYKSLLLWTIIILPYLCLIPIIIWFQSYTKRIESSTFLLINKAEYSIAQYDYKGRLIQKYPVALGKNYGNKAQKGDLKTPEGVFRLVGIEDASDWTHDFKNDSLGKIEGAYGPYFIRLDVPGQKGIGIHGTHDNNSIGTRASEGCIRMHNEDIVKLVKSIKTSSIVVIIPGYKDQTENFRQEAKTSGNDKSSGKSTNNNKRPKNK